ncbi:hypothetical protein TUM12370_34040 [Salmonella enterica subsp. enterica serovar Choleraesuis]|nr:hypothetical protein TUM12370_34040 [Salmonella enterica subsp. enterica serovar Choleraesuis]
MRIQRLFKTLLVVLAGAYFCAPVSQAANININFTGFITPGSCDVDLDRPALNLGNVDFLSLKAGAQLANIASFNASIHNCYLSLATTYRPAIQITGEGFDADGKFLFRSADSASSGIGVLLYHSAGAPQYADASLKSGDYIDLGGAGSTPSDTSLPFFVGVSCGSVADCAANAISPGSLVSRIMINFRYY